MQIVYTTDAYYIGREIDETLDIIELDGFIFEVQVRKNVGEFVILANANYIITLK
jgi:hypothetical protein